MAAVAKVPVWMSAAEFLVWEPGDGLMWQLVDGEPQAMAPASRTHEVLQGQLAGLIWERLRGGPCSVVVAPGVIPRVQASHNVRVPNIAVVCGDYDIEQAALSDPVLLVEILSPSNEAETWANVWTYTTIPSIREILVLRSATIGADLLRRQADGSWPSEPERATEGDLVLESVGLRIPLVEVYATTRLRVS